MSKYYRVRTQKQWEWLKNKLEIEDDLHVSNFPVTILYGDVFCGIYRYHDDPEPLIEVSQMMEDSRMKDYVTIETKDIEKIIDGDDDQVFIDQGDGRFTYAFVNNQELVKLKFPKSLLYPKVPMSVAEKKEFDELNAQYNVLNVVLRVIRDENIEHPQLSKKLYEGSSKEMNQAQLEFARAWADPSLIEVLPEKKWNVRVPAVDNPTYYYKTGDGVDVCKPSPTMQNLETVQFTAEELKQYGLNNDLFEKVEVKE